MQSWQADAIILSVARHGENGAILKLLSQDHGLFSAYVRGGAGRRQRGVLQVGNSIFCRWQARVEDHMGSASVELIKDRAALVLMDQKCLAGLVSATAVTLNALPERVPYPPLYAALVPVLDLITMVDATVETWAAALARYELGMLEVLGFGLDLSRCAATGVEDDLIYVSPKSGRAVSAQAGAPYKDRLLSLPPFLLDGKALVDMEDVIRALNLTGYFLRHYVLEAKSAPMPEARVRLMQHLSA